MDFSKFSAEEFDVKDWINGVFKTQLKGDKQREAYTATLVTKLQRYIQEVNKSLEDVSQQTITNFPRVLRDVETLKQEATFLWQQMQQVKEEIKTVEEQTSHSMEVLIRVDKVRTRVEQACDALKEADNWSSLASAVEDIFRSGDVNAISQQLESMKTSLKVLKNSPDYEDKVLHLEALKNRLESLVSPNIVAAFMQNNLEESKKFYAIFKTLDRPNEIRNYYLKCHRARISTKWQEIHTTDEKDRTLLKEFYDLLLSVLYSEVQWCASIFGKEAAVSIIIQLVLEVTLSVENGPASLINTAMAGLVTDKLATLLKVCDITVTFTDSLRKSISRDIKVQQIDSLMLSKLSDAFWHPYIPYFLQYEPLETETLLTNLSDVIMDAHDIIDLVQLLELSVNKVYHEATEAVERCVQLTGHYGACDLVEALEKFFSEYFDKFARQLRTIANSSGIKKLKIQSDDEDWSIFQHCIRVISTCGRLLTKNIDFNQSIISSLLTHISEHNLHELTTNDNNTTALPWERYNYLKRVEPEKYSRLCDMVSSIKENDVNVLPKTKKRVHELNQQAQNLAFDVAFAQVKRQLSSIPTTSSFFEVSEGDDTMVSESEMPSFSFSPSEEATHVGQYLMTLPQHLEPFSISESGDDSEAQSLEVALRNGSLPFPAEPGESAIENEFENLSDQWLGAIVRATEQTYIEAITQIPSLNSSGAKQLVSDLDYMSNVIDSLGLSPSTKLHNLRSLLNVPSSNKDEFKECCVKAPNKLATIISNMRNIHIEN